MVRTANWQVVAVLPTPQMPHLFTNHVVEGWSSELFRGTRARLVWAPEICSPILCEDKNCGDPYMVGGTGADFLSPLWKANGYPLLPICSVG
jgi:hypothetical protein